MLLNVGEEEEEEEEEEKVRWETNNVVEFDSKLKAQVLKFRVGCEKSGIFSHKSLGTASLALQEMLLVLLMLPCHQTAERMTVRME
jgi:hypothetical protein